MPENKAPQVEQATAAPGEKRSTPAVGRDLAPAAESSDPAVHQLLAEIQTAQLNNDKDAERDAREELRQLGYK